MVSLRRGGDPPQAAHKGERRGKKKNPAAIVVIPLAGPLKAALDAELATRKAAKISPLRLEDEMICLNSEGEPWREGRAGYNGFISSFKKAKVEAGIEGIDLSDLRGTALARLALAGCTVPEIRAITGRSPDEANAILQRIISTVTRRSLGMPSRKLEHSRGIETAVETAPSVPLRRTEKNK